jgi:hypothetical protein
MPSSRADAIPDALDRLHAAPLEGFVALRKELAAERKAAGDLEGAKAIAAAQKPSRTAWALDQVALENPKVLRAMFEAREAAAKAQKAGGADEVRAAVKEYRARVADVLAAAREALAADGSEASADQVRRMSETLQVAAVEDSETRQLLMAGRLVKDADQEDPFAGMEAGPARARPAKEVPPAKHAARNDEDRARAREDAKREAARAESKRREDAAKEKVDALAGELREAQAEARKLETAAVRAQADADRARRAADAVEERLKKAREELRGLRG